MIFPILLFSGICVAMIVLGLHTPKKESRNDIK
jgi:hypothetical protein